MRLSLALEVLDGLSVGDAIGEAMSYQWYRARELEDFSAIYDGGVRYTDDTEMALGVVDVLKQLRGIDEGVLAWKFAARFMKDPDRGYGRMARNILREIAEGTDWREASEGAFSGGSFGNGAAMRVAPIGAYFSDNLEEVAAMATRSARVTHFHPEGIAGAVAVAIAAAVATDSREEPKEVVAGRIWEAVLDHTPEGEVRSRLVRASQMADSTAMDVAKELGNGQEISAQDTVPFCVWNACRCLEDYREALLSTVEVGGDCDTNAAIVGGIICGYIGWAGIPGDWLRAREELKFSNSP